MPQPNIRPPIMAPEMLPCCASWRASETSSRPAATKACVPSSAEANVSSQTVSRAPPCPRENSIVAARRQKRLRWAKKPNSPPTRRPPSSDTSSSPRKSMASLNKGIPRAYGCPLGAEVGVALLLQLRQPDHAPLLGDDEPICQVVELHALRLHGVGTSLERRSLLDQTGRQFRDIRIDRDCMERAQRRAVHNQADVGLSGSTGAVNMVLDIAKHEQHPVLIRQVIDDALPRPFRSGLCRLGAQRADKDGEACAHNRSSFHDILLRRRSGEASASQGRTIVQCLSARSIKVATPVSTTVTPGSSGGKAPSFLASVSSVLPQAMKLTLGIDLAKPIRRSLTGERSASSMSSPPLKATTMMSTSSPWPV